MNARMNYISMPVDYVRELNRMGKRGKSRAFMEYFNDMDMGEVNAIRFYVKSWKVSLGTVHTWIKEFNDEIDKYFSHWQMKNNQHYRYIKKETEQKLNDLNTQKALNTGDTKKETEHELNKVFNINNNNIGEIQRFDKDFEDMYFRCRYSSKYTGNKESAYKEYINSHRHISHSDMAYAYMLHVNDPQTNGKIYNLTNFMKQQAYLNYLNPQIIVKKDGKEIVGYYNQRQGTILTDDNTQYTINKEKFAQMLASGDIEITKKMRAVG